MSTNQEAGATQPGGTGPDDFIQDGYVVTMGADGGIAAVQHLNPQQLATDASTDKVLAWLGTNIPEGAPWGTVDVNKEMTDANHKYNCPQWYAVAANQQRFNCGLLYFDLFNYPVPTPATVDELHRKAG